MHRRGHVGLGLLSYAPIAFALAYHDMWTATALGLVCAVFFATAPDADLWLPFVSHRGITHTVLFGTLSSLGCAGAAAYLASTGHLPGAGSDPGSIIAAAGLAFAVSLVGFGSHLLGDVLTPMGIAPFWPGSSRRYSLGLVYSRNRLANGLLSAVGTAAAVGAIAGGAMLRAGAFAGVWP